MSTLTVSHAVNLAFPRQENFLTYFPGSIALLGSEAHEEQSRQGHQFPCWETVEAALFSGWQQQHHLHRFRSSNFLVGPAWLYVLWLVAPEATSSPKDSPPSTGPVIGTGTATSLLGQLNGWLWSLLLEVRPRVCFSRLTMILLVI